MSAITDFLTDMFTPTESAEAAPVPVSELDREQKWDIATETAFRCCECDTPEFHHWLYLVPPDASTDSPLPVCESCLADAGRAEEATAETRLPRPRFGRKGYLMDVDRTETRYRKGEEVEVTAIEEHEHTKDSYYMGEYGREIVETKAEHPRDQVWIGYQERAHKMLTLGIEIDEFIQHVFITGGSGRGKSTLAITIAMQLAYGDYGFCVFDPHTELVEKLLRTLPPSRRDDVIWVNPAPENADRIVGLNFLEVDVPPDSGQYDRAVKGAVEDIAMTLKGGEFWGPKMDGIIQNICQGMILSDTNYTLVDLHEILLDQERREAFAAHLVNEGHWFVARYTRKIAKMDDTDVDPVVRRVNKWVQFRTSREIVAHKHSSVSIEEAITEGKIILVDDNVGSEDMQKLIATAITRRMYRICKRRKKQAVPSPQRPFFLLIDEVDDILSAEMDLKGMVGNARKFGLSLILMTQSPSQLENKKLVSAIGTNCKTTITFANPYPPEAQSIAAMYDCDYHTVTGLGDYTMLVMREPDGVPKGPYETEGFPDYPPLRTREEAEEWIIRPSLQRHGVERLSDEEIWFDSPDEYAGGIDANTDDEGDPRDDPLELTDERLIQVCKAFLDAAEVHGEDGEVLFEDALPRIKEYHDAGEAIDYTSIESSLLNSIPTGEDGYIERREDEEGIWIRVTATARSKIYETGTAASSGGPNHDQLLRDCYVPLLELGIRLDLLTQTGESMPDGTATIDVAGLSAIEWGALSEDRTQALMENLVDAHPELARLALGRETVRAAADPTVETPGLDPADLTLAVEAESATGDSKGGYTCLNGAKAANAGLRCLYLARPDVAPKIWKTLTNRPYYSQRGGSKTEWRCYNLGNLTIHGEQMIRPAIESDGQDETVWVRDLDTGEICLRDSDGNEHHRFEDATAVFGGPRGYPGNIPEGGESPAGSKKVKTPFLPEKEFEDGIPDPDEWEIVIIPYDADGADDLAVYRDGEEIPLESLRAGLQEQSADAPTTDTLSETGQQPTHETARNEARAAIRDHLDMFGNNGTESMDETDEAADSED